MELGQPSRTALATAYQRAYHQIADEPRVFTDPLAMQILGVDEAELIERNTATLESGDPRWPRRRRMFLAGRARFAEDTVRAAVAAGTRQVVILGAGLDTFAYRNPFPELRVYEVDHPDTQEWKRHRLAESGIDVPDSLAFVPIDFETRTLAEGLAEAGFPRDEPAVFVWLGVVMYLTRDAISGTLKYIAQQTPPTQVVLDYLVPATTSEEATDLKARADRVGAVGEPFLSFFTADDMASVLADAAFTEVEDRTATEVIAGYTGTSPQPSAGNTPRILRATN
ncbi:class I SAM-dependent methyltransferase [Nocardia sp. NBC_01327]|uniref:class I SAM-dependent methyltransferase n=1 Tax=Nocardia sp. NBC_01327 TaxID=2903593 RepID=UPI002E0E8C09|nr:class I SAM-dependent methyltransferase [Nocardia sp. NBC_01327]